MDAVNAIQWVIRTLGVLALIHSLEFFWLYRTMNDQGVWRWADLKLELGRGLGVFLNFQSFMVLNAARIAFALDVMHSARPMSLLILLLIHILTLLRWRGTFNGGSDSMALLLLWTTTLAAFAPQLTKFCLYYMTFQLSLSYLKAGWFKFKNPRWRNGSALFHFVNSPNYESRPFLKTLALKPALSWAIIAFELLFPIGLLSGSLALMFIILGIGFHVLNAYTFGLNRFLWTWLAAYPAFYYCAHLV